MKRIYGLIIVLIITITGIFFYQVFAQTTFDLTAKEEGTNISLSWNKIDNIDNYIIHTINKNNKDETTNRETYPVESKDYNNSTNKMEYTITDLKPNNTYEIYIETKTSNDEEVSSEHVSVTTKEKIWNIWTEVNYNEIYLIWDGDEEATYKVYRMPLKSELKNDPILISETNEAFYRVKNLKNKTDYEFFVTIIKDGKEIGRTKTIRTSTIEEIKDVKYNIKDSVVNLTWDKLNDSAEYRIYYKDSKKNITLGGTTTNNNIIIKDIKYNENYKISIIAYENNKEIAKSKEIDLMIIPINKNNTKVEGISNKTYNGKYQTQNVQVITNGKVLKYNEDYNIKYENNLNVGTATYKIIGKGKYIGEIKDTFKINKINNSMTIKAKNKKVKYRKLKKKSQIIKPIKIKKAQGKITYSKISGNSKIKINKNNGKITIVKGTKKGTYKIKIKVTASGNNHYKSLSKTVNLNIKIK